MDFNNASFNVDFPADEGIFVIDVPISVVDDYINENKEQLFVVLMEVVYATNFLLLDNTHRNLSLCRIVDNDGKYVSYLDLYFSTSSLLHRVDACNYFCICNWSRLSSYAHISYLLLLVVLHLLVIA